VLVRVDSKRWAAHAKGKPVVSPTNGDLVLCATRSRIHKHMRRLGCPACRINRNLLPSEVVRKSVEAALA
jgi:hypothetical protein